MKFGKLIILIFIFLSIAGIGDSLASCTDNIGSVNGWCNQSCDKNGNITEQCIAPGGSYCSGADYCKFIQSSCACSYSYGSYLQYCKQYRVIKCTSQVEADSVNCVLEDKIWQNNSCYTLKEACELNGGNWLNDECIGDENFGTCIPVRDICKSKNGVFFALSIINNVCSYECEIDVEKNILGLKYDNSKYYIIDKKSTAPIYFEIDKAIFDYIESEMKNCKENSIKLFRGILNGGYIYWKSNESEPSGVSDKIILK